MSRLISRGIWDCRLLFRNGFHYAAVAVALMLIGLLVWVPQQQVSWILPVALLGNLVTNGFYFMAAIVLLEKAERSLNAQVVTPLRAWEYLLAKLVSLCLLSVAESMTIVMLAYEGSVDWPVLVLGIVTMTSLFAGFGFLLVARYESINEFLFPSILVSALLSLPLLNVLGVWPSTFWYLHPLHGPLELISTGFEPQPGMRFGAAAAVAVVWVAAVFAACIQRFHRLVVDDLGRA